MHLNLKRFGLYLLRWQASTPILAAFIWLLAGWGYIWSTVVANLVGGSLFYAVDRFIFTSQTLAEQWEVKENVACVDCGKVARGYRLVRAKNYDKSDAVPEFRCERCSQKKTENLRDGGKL